MLKPAFLTFAAVIAFAGAAVAQGAAAPPQTPAKRTVLQQTDVSTEAPQEVIFGTVEIAPGTGNPFHTHFGTEIGYVVQGHIRVERKGEPPQDLGPGQSFLIPRGVVHHSVPLGSEPVKLAVGGVLAYSLALAPSLSERGTYALSPESLHPPLRQRMVLLKRASDTAQRFYRYLQQPAAREILRKFGFAVPGD